MTVTDYARIERAIHYLDEHYREQPALGDVARAIGLSEFHFQRLFSRWAGVTPKRFVQHLTAQRATELLRERRSALHAAYEAGLSGPGRLHDLVVNAYAVTPGEVRERGKGLVITHGTGETPFGPAHVASTDRGIVALTFLGDIEEDDAAASVEADWPEALHVRDDDDASRMLARVFERGADGAPLGVLVRGTNFQLRVWDALLRIPAGSVATYEDVAGAIGRPTAMRAVGAAIGRNPIAYLIPCHRVIRKTGAFGEYRWGAARKRAILAWETSRS